MMPAMNGSLLLAGAGKMGGALAAGWLVRSLKPEHLIVQDPSPPPEVSELLSRRGVACHREIPTLPAPPAVIVVAVKPQLMDNVFPALARLAGPETLILSVAAGKTIASFDAHLAKGSPVVRCIPNTPAAVGRGITVCCAGPHVKQAQRDLAQALLSAVGEVGWVEDEGLIDAATAVSGSGPAYIFLMTECLAQAARQAGIPDDLAKQLARATVCGAAELMHHSGLPPDVLRRNVTSPRGTTAAALEVLMDDKGLQPLMTSAVLAAMRRSRELSG